MPTSPSVPSRSNVRWDEVVDPTVILSLMAPTVPQRRDEDGQAGDVRVHVRLFGGLTSIAAVRTLDLVMPKPATVATVMAAMGERLGEAFLAHVVDSAGTKKRYCRLFVAGAQIEDLRTLINVDSVDVEMILLVAMEGG